MSENSRPAALTKRLLAFLIDMFLLAPFALNALLGHLWLQPLLLLSYFAFMESSSWKATLGKRLFSIQVVQADGQAITFSQACIRNVCKLLTIPLMLLFTIPMFFSKKKQGLHDLAVDSYVIDGKTALKEVSTR